MHTLRSPKMLNQLNGFLFTAVLSSVLYVRVCFVSGLSSIPHLPRLFSWLFCSDCRSNQRSLCDSNWYRTSEREKEKKNKINGFLLLEKALSNMSTTVVVLLKFCCFLKSYMGFKIELQKMIFFIIME